MESGAADNTLFSFYLFRALAVPTLAFQLLLE